MSSDSVCAPASKTSVTSSRSPSPKPLWELTISRISSVVIAAVPRVGPKPSARGIRLDEVSMTQMTGVMSLANISNGGATITDTRLAFCMAMRLGTSSPNTLLR